ncbi:hypothetical protein M011DRAFT_14120 [Sporormia fimetaria CBS 119925]|uniref:Ricin B lectin domain-containing protein n=1 Tax=Sporormia fimetaria CBS 119925 TaxID=1340428 RepID=A0A6A6VN48_9PLEO|nr:hypothetical protein M011DRAFT_14120 [Sporormia fimetaria CBS 119925]
MRILGRPCLYCFRALSLLIFVCSSRTQLSKRQACMRNDGKRKDASTPRAQKKKDEKTCIRKQCLAARRGVNGGVLYCLHDNKATLLSIGVDGESKCIKHTYSHVDQPIWHLEEVRDIFALIPSREQHMLNQRCVCLIHVQDARPLRLRAGLPHPCSLHILAPSLADQRENTE